MRCFSEGQGSIAGLAGMLFYYLDISKPLDSFLVQQYEIIILGGLTGRLDQTIHTLSYLHKLRKDRNRVFAVTDDNVGWVLDSVSTVISFGSFSYCNP